MRQTETITGKIERVRFQRDAFMIGALKPDTASEDLDDLFAASSLLTFKGDVPAKVGDRVNLEGYYIDDPKWGRQFTVTGMSFDIAATFDGLAEFIADNRELSGIGPKRAGDFADALANFGPDVETAFANATDDELADLSKLRSSAVKAIRRDFLSKTNENNVLVTLRGYGLTAGQAKKLHDEFGGAILGIVAENPYWLIGRVRGFGFMRVDEIALKVGVDKRDPNRLGAALNHWLGERAQEGSTLTVNTELVESVASKLLKFDNPNDRVLLRNRLDELVETGEFSEVDGMIARRSLFEAEVFLADTFQGATSNPSPLFPEPLTVAQVREIDPEILDGQAEAVVNATRSRVSVITGGAGVGKTYTINVVIKAFRGAGAKVGVAAPTGKAAKRAEEATGIGASTVHRLLSAKPDGSEEGFGFEFNEKNPLPFDLVVIDEVSMVDVSLFRHLLKAIGPKTSVVLVGDFNQLPSVGPGAVLRDVIRNELLPVATLTETVRSAGALAANINGVLTGAVAPTFEGNRADGAPIAPWYVLDRASEPNRVLDSVEVLLRERFASYTFEETGERVDPFADVQILAPQKSKENPVSTYRLNLLAQRIYQEIANGLVVESVEGNRRPELYEGDKVIFTRNDYDLGVMNGSTGRVLHVDDSKGKGKRSIAVEFDGLGEKKITGGSLNDLELAYALTVHKSQGSEYPVVLFVCHSRHFYGLRNRSLFYTAVSRARKTAMILGDVKGIRAAARNVKTDERLTLLGLSAGVRSRALDAESKIDSSIEDAVAFGD